MKFEDYQMAIVGYLITWGCNSAWSVNRLYAKKAEILSNFNLQLTAESCAKELAGY